MDPGAAPIGWFFAAGCFLAAILVPLLVGGEDRLASAAVMGGLALLGGAFVWLALVAG